MRSRPLSLSSRKPPGALDQLVEIRLDRLGRDARERHHEALGERVLEVGGEQAERRERAGVARKDGALHLHLARHGSGVLAAGTAEGDKGEVARIGAALDRDLADRLGEIRRHDPVDAGGGFFDAHVELVGDPAKRLGGACEVQAQRSPQQPLGVEDAEDQICVRHRRPGAATAIAGGAGIRSGRFGADPQRAAGVEPDDRAAACTDRVDVDALRAGGDAPFHLDRVAAVRLAVADQAHVQAGAAHVDGADIGLARAWRQGTVRRARPRPARNREAGSGSARPWRWE